MSPSGILATFVTNHFPQPTINIGFYPIASVHSNPNFHSLSPNTLNSGISINYVWHPSPLYIPFIIEVE